MKLTHGSPQNIQEKGGFDLIDYKFDESKKDDDNGIPNGADVFGPGIYTFVADGALRKEAADGAVTYANNGGYVHFCSMDIEEGELMNNRDPEEISEEQWIEIIENYMKIKRNAVGHDQDVLRDILYQYEDSIDAGSFDLEAFNESVSKVIDFDLDMEDYEDYEEGHEWLDAIMNDYEMLDPCSHVFDEGGPRAIYNYAMSSSDNLWEVLHSISVSVAYKSDGTKGFTDNKSFQRAFFETMDDLGSYKGAVVFEGKFFVAFDHRALEIDKVVQFKRKENSSEMTL